MKEFGIRISLIVLLAIFIASGWYFLAPLFLDRSVQEDAPFHFPRKDEIGMILPPGPSKAEETAARLFPKRTLAAHTAPMIIMGVANAPRVSVTYTLTITPTLVPTTTEESAASNEPLVMGRGSFVDADIFHKGEGVAMIYQMPDGAYILRLEDFKVTNGPALHVILSTNAHPTDQISLGRYLDLGLLKDNIGDQQYALPDDFEPGKYHSVVIHCLPFQTIFSVATLK